MRPVIVTTTCKPRRTPRRKGWSEVERFESREHAISWLRGEIGCIDGQSDEEWLAACKIVGITFGFEDVNE